MAWAVTVSYWYFFAAGALFCLPRARYIVCAHCILSDAFLTQSAQKCHGRSIALGFRSVARAVEASQGILKGSSGAGRASFQKKEMNLPPSSNPNRTRLRGTTAAVAPLPLYC